MEVFSRIMAALMILILAPIFIFIFSGSILFQGFPVLFRQERIGFQFIPFKVIKFRTMVVNNQKTSITIDGDDRITIWGSLLRHFKLDELPQLINVCKGEMRFIGPRPEVKEYVDIQEFSFLSRIKPGLSDFSSIIFRDEERILSLLSGEHPYKDTILPLKVKLNQLYADNKSLTMDFKLAALTLTSIVLPKSTKIFIISRIISPFNSELANDLKNLLNNLNNS